MAFSDFDHGFGGLLIFTSSVAALYAFVRRCFYRCRPFHRGGLKVRLLLLRFRPQLETIVHRASEIMLAAENKSTGAPAAMIVFAYQQMLHQIFKTPCPLGGLLRLSADNIKIISTLTGGCAAGIFAVPQVDDDRVRGLLDRDHVRTFSVIVIVDDKRSQALFKMLNKIDSESSFRETHRLSSGSPS
jgi:hypothetical protein